MVVAERRVPLGSVLNFRDLGGYRSGEAGMVRWGQVFRSDSLHRLDREYLEAFSDLGVQVVYDLRSIQERESFPSVDLAVHLPIPSRSPEGSVANLRSRYDGERWLHEEYLYMLAHAGAAFGALLSQLAEPERRPALFHCAGGKDRTGLAAALLLSWLGVQREVVLDDYELTSQHAPVDSLGEVVETFCSAGMTEAAAEGVLSTPRWAMAAALDELDDGYGGIHTYLRGPAGMNEESLAALSDQLLTHG
jgi:protein-tyrosine phosphatase